jgi:choline-sulfatase
MQPQNLVIVMSDEHNPKMLGCAGHPLVKTPNLDRLAARGTRFTRTYCGSPVCIPARAVFHTGRYIHEIGFWDNADPYDGSVTSWQHIARAGGHHVAAIGKLHFRSTADDNGFNEEIITMHVVDGLGDLMGLVRENLPRRGSSKKMATLAGPGESDYTRYDRAIAAEAARWLSEEAPKHRDKPWILMVSFVAPHFPLTAPAEFFELYPLDRMPLPKQYAKGERPQHPYLKDYAGSFAYDDYFKDESEVRRAIAGYLGLCSSMDANVGTVMGALERLGLANSTRVLYTSDHGDNVGARGLWGKSTLYEEAAGVPMIVAGAGIPAGAVCDTVASHVDCFPFILEAVGAMPPACDTAASRHSVAALATGLKPERTVLSEYHGMGSTTGAFMIRHGRWKYVHYVSYAPQLFDLEADPEELVDLADDPRHRATIAECHAKLLSVCDPAAVDARAKRRQAEQLARNGGRAAVIERGDLGYSPPPGVAVEFT